MARLWPVGKECTLSSVDNSVVKHTCALWVMPALGRTDLYVLRDPAAHCEGAEWPERAADHSPPVMPRLKMSLWRSA